MNQLCEISYAKTSHQPGKKKSENGTNRTFFSQNNELRKNFRSKNSGKTFSDKFRVQISKNMYSAHLILIQLFYYMEPINYEWPLSLDDDQHHNYHHRKTVHF